MSLMPALDIGLEEVKLLVPTQNLLIVVQTFTLGSCPSSSSVWQVVKHIIKIAKIIIIEILEIPLLLVCFPYGKTFRGKMNSLKHSLFLLGTLLFVTKANCGLRPYYIHFPPPPPPPGFPVPNGLEPIPFPYHPWPQRNLTFSRNLPGDPIPVIVHTWVNPETSDGIKLQNGTLIYYVPPPWGGIRSSSPTSVSPQQTTTRMNNSLLEADDFPTFSPGENEIERQSLFEAPNRQTGGGYADSAKPGLQASSIDITTPPPSKDGPWGHGHSGFGWPTSTQLYDKLPETTTTGTIPTRSQSGDNPTTTVNSLFRQTTTTLQPTTLQATTTTSGTTSTTTTPDPIAANTNARYPVSDSVRKFRRIVAQIRAITKKELGSPQLKRSKS